MHAHYLQHVSFEGLGSIETWLLEAGYEISCTRLYQGDSLPSADRFDLLIVMGGPMSVNDEFDYPWLAEEKRFIRNAIDRGCPVLGICLGAQLIASALGARVYANPLKEIGWHPIQRVEPDEHAGVRFPPFLEVFHWHGETFDLPAGAVHLARSKGCENQAYAYRNNVVGLQFHLETTPESARKLVIHCRDELIPDRYVQDEEAILENMPERYTAINRMMGELLSWLTSEHRP